MNDQSIQEAKGRRIFVFLFAIAVPIATKMYLNAPIGVVSILVLSLPIVALGYVARIKMESFGWVRYPSALVNAGAGILVLVGILITPLSAYTSWFDSFVFGTPEGGVSNLFVIITGFFSSVLSPTALTMGVAWPVIMVGFALLYLLAIIVQTQAFLILVLGFLVLVSGYVAYRSVARVRRDGAFAFTLSLLGAALVISIVVPRFETPPGDDYVNETLYPRLRAAVVDAVPRFPLLYAAPGYGIRFDEKHLGGTPTLLPNPIFTITANPSEILYLRSRIFDTYDGSSWSMSPYFAGRATDSLRSQFFGDLTDHSDEDVRIEIAARNFGFLPYTLDSQMIIVESGFPKIAEGGVDTGFRLGAPLMQNDVLYLRRANADESDQVAVPDLSGIEKRIYAQIPNDLPQELNIIAEGLSEGIESHEQILANIEAFLAMNYTYSLDVEEFAYVDSRNEPGANDFVYSFLFSESGGYCVQFATSFIILARLNDIPARYATGYLAYMSDDGTPTQVSGLSAHAWPEVWLPSTGWINWEATPAANIANYTNVGDSWTFHFDLDSGDATSRQIEGLIGATFSDADLEMTDGSGRWWRIVLIVLAGVIGSGAIVMLSIVAIRLTRLLFRNESHKFYHHAKKMSRSLARRGVPLPQYVGWDSWFGHVDRRLDSSNGEHGAMKLLIMKLTYTDEEIVSEHTEKLITYRRHLAKLLRRTRLGRTKKVTKS